MAGRALAAGVLTAALGLAAPPEVRRGEAIQVTDWFTHPGAPSAIHSLAAGAEDFLWAASDQGLFRFDGLHFHRMDPQPVRHVAVTRDGDVWFGGDAGLRVRRGVTSQPVHGEAVIALAAQGDHVAWRTKTSVWFGGRAGMTDLRVQANGALTVDRENRIWFACGAEACAVDAAGRLSRSPLGPGPWPLVFSGDGLWSVRPLTVARNGEVTTVQPGPAALPDGRLAFGDSRGRTWLGTSEWLEQGALYQAPDPHPGGYYHAVFAEDRLRQMWVGSTEKPLGLIVTRPWRPLWLPMGAVETVIRTASGRLLAGGEAGWSESFDEGGHWSLWATAATGAAKAWDAIETAKGTWVISQQRGVLLLDRAGRELFAMPGTAPPGPQFRRFWRDRAGRLWVGAKAGLYRLNEEALRLEPAKLPPGTLSPLVFATGPDGQEWMASSSGIAKLVDGEWKIEVPAEVFLFASRLGALAVGPGPEFWVGYRREGPFSRVRRENGAWKRTDFAADDGYEPNYTRALLRDRRGWIWRGTPGGLAVSDGQRLAAHEWIRFETPHEGVSDGGLMEDRDGSVWVGSSLGIHHLVPPPDWFDPIRTSKPRVTAWWADGVPDFAPRDGQRWPSGVNRLKIDYAQWPAARPRRPANAFRLVPLEKDWRYSATGSVTYDNLPAGSYRFEVRGDRGGAIESITFETGSPSRPPWLWSLAGAGSIGLVWFLWARWNRPVALVEYWQAKQAFLEAKEREAEAPAEPRLIADRYVLGAPLGSGGFSTVYRALDETTGRTVALKLLPAGAEMPEWQRSRFDREIAALARLAHPGVVRLLDAGETPDGALYLVMPVIEGESLREVLMRGPVDRTRLVEWVSQVGAALEAAHQDGVLHRDLKPENILIDGESGRAIVVDFGAAAVRDSAANGRSTLMLGSLDYLAPEQVQGRSSPQTDIYAFAVVVFELCTGLRYRSLADGSEAGLRHAVPSFSPALAAELARGLRFDPAGRPEAIGPYAEALAALLRQR